jgi:hypothetical protein
MEKDLLLAADKVSMGVISTIMEMSFLPKESKHGDFTEGAYTYSYRKTLYWRACS